VNRDEILAEIKRLSEQPVAYVFDLAYNMREVARLADAYRGDVQYLAEALTDAHENFADRTLSL
jgi:hypothetical protein